MRCGFRSGSTSEMTMASLIDVGDEHMLPPAAGPCQDPVPRFDALDHALFGAVDRGRGVRAGRSVARRSASDSWLRPLTSLRLASDPCLLTP